jgi:hypothetical protein
MALPISSERAGHIVALDGPSELISTQLRLLPTSQHILILPSLQHYLKNTNPDAPFDPRELIHRYHTAAQARHAEGLEFLRPSTSTKEKRLVFLHGGTMSAQVSCLSTIMERETNGDIEEAYATFIRLVSNGVAGLSPARLSYTSTCDSSESTERDEPPEPAASSEDQGRQDAWTGCMQIGDDDTIEDRIIRAMRAADALDKETEFLQPATPTVDLTVKLVDIPSRSKKAPVSTVEEPSKTLRGSRPPSPPDDLEAPPPADPVPRVSAEQSAAEQPASAAAPRKPPLRIRIPSPPIPWAGDVAAGATQQSSIKVYQPQGPSFATARHRSTRTSESDLSPTQQKSKSDDLCDTVGVPTDSQGEPEPEEEASAGATESEIAQAAEDEGEPFEAVLPLLEDLVVFFTPETTDELHNFVVRRLSEVCKTPISARPLSNYDAFQGPSHLVLGEDQEVDDTGFEDEHAGGISPWMRNHGLPTPNHSPTLLDVASVAAPLPGTRLYSICVGQETAVSIQNFLRSFLGSRFPLQGRRFSTVENAEFPSEAGLWRPLECDGRVTSPAGELRLDLILAVGAETGVKKGRLSEVVGQIEKLGFKTSGHSRSGRLDIRYVIRILVRTRREANIDRFLIANAMQAFTAQPLTKQTQSNPFADRALLAALIIPHLETYLETHPDVRFLLIEYPSEHLPTVLALQTLIGTEMMKVVGIINSDASSPTQSLALPDANRRPSEGFRSLNRRGSSTSGTFVGPCSFSKANFLLASSATGFETAAFVAAIRESLISISDYYIPERPLYKPPASQSPPRKKYPSLTASTKSSPSQKEASHISGSMLIITPPSSPTESSPSAQPQSNSRSIPPRSSSVTAASTPTPIRAPRLIPPVDSDGLPINSRIRWGEVNYARDPSSSSPPSAPSLTTTTNSITTGSSTSTTAAESTSSHTRRPHHQKKDSDPLSPCGIRPSASATARSVLAKGGLADNLAADDLDLDHGGEHEDDDDDDDDLIRDEEMRRLMPLYLRRREDIERMRSTKAFKWLGLA